MNSSLKTFKQFQSASGLIKMVISQHASARLQVVSSAQTGVPQAYQQSLPERQDGANQGQSAPMALAQNSGLIDVDEALLSSHYQ